MLPNLLVFVQWLCLLVWENISSIFVNVFNDSYNLTKFFKDVWLAVSEIAGLADLCSNLPNLDNKIIILLVHRPNNPCSTCSQLTTNLCFVSYPVSRPIIGQWKQCSFFDWSLIQIRLTLPPSASARCWMSLDLTSYHNFNQDICISFY